MRWVWRGSALAALLIGWLFIAWQNHFHITPPVVFVCLAYLAVVATIYNLWRTGASAVSESDDENDSTWAKPAGALGELEREKRTLLKAIKEAEFDHQMGKLSKHDADDMIRIYRARAIEVIKEIDRHGLGAAGSAREQIMREVRARLEIEAKSGKKAGAAKAEGNARGKSKQKPGKQAVPPEPAVAAAAKAEEPAAPVEGAAPPAPADSAAKPATTAAALDDEAMDADSTTTVEPTREDSKEASP